MPRNIRIQTFVVPESFDATLVKLEYYAPKFEEFKASMETKKTKGGKADGRYKRNGKNRYLGTCIRFAIAQLVKEGIKKFKYNKGETSEVQEVPEVQNE